MPGTMLQLFLDNDEGVARNQTPTSSPLSMESDDFKKVKDNLQCFNRPIYETLISTFQEMITSGELAPGTKFPPDKKLAIELGISHITLARALNELRRRNVLERRRASGTFVPMEQRGDTAQPPRRQIAVVFDDASEKTFQQQLFLQLHHGLEELGCAMVFYSSGNDAARQVCQLKEILKDFSISGCLVWSLLSKSQAEEVLSLRPRYYPLIFLDKHYAGLEHDAVTYSNYECGMAIGKELRRRKVRECHWVIDSNSQEHSSVTDRLTGLLAGLQGTASVRTTLLPMEAGQAVPDLSFAPSSAVVCADNGSARHLKALSMELGSALPRRLYDFETVVDDHSDIPEFTSYCFPCTLGTEALKILASRLNGKEACTVNHTGKWDITRSVRSGVPAKRTTVKK